MAEQGRAQAFRQGFLRSLGVLAGLAGMGGYVPQVAPTDRWKKKRRRLVEDPNRPLLFGGRGRIRRGSGDLARDAGSSKAGHRGGCADPLWGTRVGERG